MSNLELNKRDGNIPNSAKKCRKCGKIPGVLYGKAMSNLLFEVGEMELVQEICAHGEHGVVEFGLNGEGHKALIKEVQRDPLTNKIIHIDLEELAGKSKIVSSVPIHYVGEEYINKRGTVLQKEKDSVKVECSIENLPKFININVGEGHVGAVYKLGDLEVASEISILDDLNSVIAAVSYERKTVADDMTLINSAESESDSKK